MATDFPVLIEADITRDLPAWASTHREQVREQLAAAGALLLRGFDVSDAGTFAQFITATTSGALAYTERSSPRRAVLAHANIYTSTQYPPERPIFPHNEQSYNLRFPSVIAFCCLTPAAEGGETPIADTRAILARLDPKIVRTLHERKYRYVRNFDGVCGLPWQTAFQVENRNALERYCAAHGIELGWDASGQALRTVQVREVLARHPQSGELCWFNHLTFFHACVQEPDILAMLREMYQEQSRFPHATFFGDGADIDPEIVGELRAAYESASVSVTWQRGDVLLLDNMLAAHGRAPYTGERHVITALAEPLEWDAVAVHEPV